MRVSLEQLVSSAATFGFSWSRNNKVHKGVGASAKLVSNKVSLLKLMPHNGSESVAREVMDKAAHAIGWTSLHALVDSALTVRQQTVRDAIANGELKNDEAAIMEYVAARALGVQSSRTVTVTVTQHIVTIGGTDYTLPQQAEQATRARVESLVALGVTASKALAAAKEEFAKYAPTSAPATEAGKVGAK